MRSPLPVHLAALVIGALMAVPSHGAAQRNVVDEATLVLTRRGTAVGREVFRIQTMDSGRVLHASSQAAPGGGTVKHDLSVDAASRHPVAYEHQARDVAGRVTELLRVTSARRGRLSASRQRAGMESAKDYILGPNPVILDAGVYHHFALLPLLDRTPTLTVIVPGLNTSHPATVREEAASSVRIEGRDVSARHFTISTAEGRHEVWVDERGRLLKVSTSDGTVALREEPPGPR